MNGIFAVLRNAASASFQQPVSLTRNNSYEDNLDRGCFARNKLIDMPWKILSSEQWTGPTGHVQRDLVDESQQAFALFEPCQALAGERVGTLVHGVPGVTLHPAPIDGVRRGGRLEPLP